MRSKVLVLVMFMCLSIAVVALAAPQSSSSTGAEMSATLTPKTTQVTGNAAITLKPAKYPLFYEYQSNDPTCGDYLKAQFKVQTGDEDNGIADSGMSLAPIYLKSKYGNGFTGGQQQDWTKCSELEIKGFQIPEDYRKKAGVLVTWTVRIEGSSPQCYSVRGPLCSTNWSGTSSQAFPGGEAKTKLKVNGKAKGPEAVMTIPEGKKCSITETPPPTSAPGKLPPGDPTHTGSYLITAADFDGLLPATLDLEIYWKNETCQILTSPAKMRSMIVTLLPDATQASTAK